MFDTVWHAFHTVSLSVFHSNPSERLSSSSFPRQRHSKVKYFTQVLAAQLVFEPKCSSTPMWLRTTDFLLHNKLYVGFSYRKWTVLVPQLCQHLPLWLWTKRMVHLLDMRLYLILFSWILCINSISHIPCIYDKLKMWVKLFGLRHCFLLMLSQSLTQIGNLIGWSQFLLKSHWLYLGKLKAKKKNLSLQPCPCFNMQLQVWR